MRLTRYTLLFIFFLCPALSFADDTPAAMSKLGWRCDACSDDSGTKRLLCLSYLDGIRETHDSYVENRMIKEPMFCPPSTVTEGDFLKTFLDYCLKHENNRDFRASSSVIVSWMHAWPCKTSGQNTHE